MPDPTESMSPTEEFNAAFLGICNRLALAQDPFPEPPDFTIRSNDGDFELVADPHEVRARQRLEDAMQREKEDAYRDRANKGLW